MKKLAVALAGALLLVGGAVLYADAAQKADVGVTLTGCLNPGGELKSVAIGRSPDKPCKKNETLVRLGDGDITDVNAGTGLQGGADSGAATLAIAPSFRLPQNCGGDQVAKWTGSAWACADDAGADIAVRSLAVGDVNCPSGGAAITAAGQTAYACNGATGPQGPRGPEGPQGPPGSGGGGTLTSPSGEYSVQVSDLGIFLHGPGGTLVVDATGSFFHPDQQYGR